MYIDEYILKILFKTGDDEDKLSEIVGRFHEGIGEIMSTVIKRYFTDTNIKKPKIKSFVELAKLVDEEYRKNFSEEKIQDMYLDAIKTASLTHEFQFLLEKALDIYTAKLVKDQIPNLSQEEKEEIRRYLKEKEKIVNDNITIYKQALEEYRAELKQGSIKPISFTRV